MNENRSKKKTQQKFVKIKTLTRRQISMIRKSVKLERALEIAVELQVF